MSLQTAIPIKEIVPGRNPRTYFDPDEMAELQASVREQGVIQSILVRPLADGKYEIVAGERRYRAAKAELGDAYPIPAIVKEMTDAEADELALTENIQRADMSPTEEAVAASRILGRCSGDRAEAALHLGWSQDKLDKRLALMNCSDSVRQALNERKIQLGHAELLASATKDKQDAALRVILEKNIPVSDVKAMLQKIAKVLSAAIFDRSDCAACPHNSDLQATMFSETIGAGACTNGTCFDAKTESELERRRDALKENYPRVEIVRSGEQYTITKVVAEGATGVGQEQADACRACANYGAVVSAVPDKCGKVYEGQCFDVSCNQKKVAARIKAEKEALATAKEQPTTATNAKAAGKKDSPDSKGKTVKPPVTSVHESMSLKAYRVKVWRQAATVELTRNPEMNMVALLALGAANELRHVSGHKLMEAIKKIVGLSSSNLHYTDALQVIHGVDDAKRRHILLGLAATSMANIDEVKLRQTMEFLKVDLGAHWKLNQEYLDILTKSEIEVVCEELGLKAALGDGFSKTMNLKKDEAIKALLSINNFDYAGRIPQSMTYQLNEKEQQS